MIFCGRRASTPWPGNRAGNCNLRDYLEAEGKAAGLLQGALYRQGFRDCVQALHLLGVLGMRTA